MYNVQHRIQNTEPTPAFTINALWDQGGRVAATALVYEIPFYIMPFPLCSKQLANPTRNSTYIFLYCENCKNCEDCVGDTGAILQRNERMGWPQQTTAHGVIMLRFFFVYRTNEEKTRSNILI